MAKNEAPIAVLTITPDVVILPNVIVTLDGSKSTDTNKKGKPVNYIFYIDNVVISNSKTENVIDFNAPEKEGDYQMKLDVMDRKGLIGTTAKTLKVSLPAAPTADAGQSQTVQLPAKVHLKGTGTGTGITYLWEGLGVIANPASAETDVDVPEGVYNYLFVVKDQFGRTETSSTEVTVKPVSTQSKTQFGASGPLDPASNDRAVLDLLGVKLTRLAIRLNGYDSSKGYHPVDILYDAGYDVCLNLNVEDIQKDSQGNKIPNPFMTDLVKYEALIRPVFQRYAKKVKLFAIENEPTNKRFHSGPMSDYLKLLAKAVSVGHEYGAFITDGCVHVETVGGAKTDEGNTSDAMELLKGYKNIPLDCVNIHGNGKGSTYPAGAIVKSVDVIREVTGHRVGSNEFHTENATIAVLIEMVKQWKEAGVDYCIYISGAGDNTTGRLNIGLKLTDLGIAYRDAIK